MVTDSPQLDYAPRSRPRPRIWLARTVVVLLALALLPLLWRLGRGGYEIARYRRLYSRCAAHVEPAGKVVLDVPVVLPPKSIPEWDDLNGGARRALNMAFLHELRTVAGERRLVAIELVPGDLTSTRTPIDLLAILHAPPAFMGMPRPLPKTSQLGLDLNQIRRIHAGQLDGSDPSHFTIDVDRTDGRTITIDGWLKDDETVVLEPRGNPTTSP